MDDERPPPEIPGYRVVRVIGVGGMGGVYEAEKLATHETFAVKLVHEHLQKDKAYAARFEREVKALRDIRHPNVVEVYEWSLPPAVSAARPYVVMELLDGETLQQLVRREAPVPPGRAVAIMLQVLDGLAAAHKIGVLHRDLGPSNVFLTKRADGKLRVKLLDFGLARPAMSEDGSSAVTQPGTLVGKPAYAPPELFRELPVVEASDVFGCGMMLYLMLAGRLPYTARQAQMLWVERFTERTSHAPYTSIREFNTAVPESLVDIVDRATRKDVGERYQTAREFQKALLDVETSLQELPSSTVARLAELAGREARMRAGQPSEPSRPAGDPPSAATAGGVPSSAFHSMVERQLRAGRNRLRVAGGVAALVLVVVLVLALSGGSKPRRAATSGSAGAGDDSTAAALVASATDAGSSGAESGAVAPAGEQRAADGAMGQDAPGAGPAADRGTGDGPDAPSEGGVAEASPVDVAPALAGTVTFTFAGLPPRAEVRVNGRKPSASGVLELPRSDRPVEVTVTVPGERYRTWSDRVIPDVDRTIRPALRRVGAARTDAGAAREAGMGTIEGQTGTVFAVDYP